MPVFFEQRRALESSAECPTIMLLMLHSIDRTRGERLCEELRIKSYLYTLHTGRRSREKGYYFHDTFTVVFRNDAPRASPAVVHEVHEPICREDNFILRVDRKDIFNSDTHDDVISGESGYYQNGPRKVHSIRSAHRHQLYARQS